MRKFFAIVGLATLLGSPVLAQTSADDPSLFSIGPSETPSDAVIVEGKVKGQNHFPNIEFRLGSPHAE